MILCGIQTDAMQSNAYKLVLPRFPLVDYFSTHFVMPTVELANSVAGTPFSDIKIPGDKPIFHNFSFNFLVNEGMTNYEEILKWINNIGFAESNTAFTNYSNKDAPYQSLGQQDAMVMVLSNKGNVLRQITFFDAFPVSLSGGEFTSQDPTTSYISASVTMAYTRFALTPLS